MLKISFDFDETTQKVSNLKVVNTSVTASTKEYDLEVDENKLNLTSDAVSKLGAVAGDRISVNYWTVDNQTTYPIISKSDVFTDGSDGNKMTKKGTVSFKGQQRSSLLKFGSLFTFSEFKDKSGNIVDNVFILSPVEDDRTTINEQADFTEEKENATVLYFSAKGKDPQALLRELQSVYACCTAAGIVKKDGETYVALEVDADEPLAWSG